MSILFNRAKQIEAQIEQFFDKISDAGLIFSAGINNYIDGDYEQFQTRLKDIKKHEGAADDLRREIRYQLYTKMLIPESRGDVLGLLETSDNVIDTTKIVLAHFDIEQPQIYPFLKDGFRELTKASVESLTNLVRANHAFFKNNDIIRDYIHKVFFFEHEADRIEENLKRSIFHSEEIPRLSEKMQLRDFVASIAGLSDDCEDVAERLSVYSIKRSL